jgi:hypothetical protein
MQFYFLVLDFFHSHPICWEHIPVGPKGRVFKHDVDRVGGHGSTQSIHGGIKSRRVCLGEHQ